MIDLLQTEVRHHATIDSTNNEARRLFEQGERGPLWVLADEQTAGRGRLERKWVSEKGNLYSTLLLHLDGANTLAGRTPQLGFAVALAVADVASRYATGVSLKWPNDVLVNGAKVSGILCDVIAPDVVAIGCGINVAHAPQGLNYPTTSLSGATRDEVFLHYRTRFSHWFEVWCEGFSAIREAWMARAIGIGQSVSMSVGTQCHTGIFTGLEDDGAIILKQGDNSSITLHAGDLTIPSLQSFRKQTA